MYQDDIEMLNETLSIAEKGVYTNGKTSVKLKLSHPEMLEARVLLPVEVHSLASAAFPDTSSSGGCAFSCENVDSFSAALRMAQAAPQSEKPVLVLNFANPVNPGGGVRSGARAQEEDLCRKSTLLLSLEGAAAEPYYVYNRGLQTFMGSDALIVSPRVEILRDASGALLPETAVVAALTCAAPMLNYGYEGLTEAGYRETVFRRICGMLRAAAYFGYRELVLGAWGCGAFRNDAAVMAELFSQAFAQLRFGPTPAAEWFRRVVFAVLDRSDEKYNFTSFSRFFSRQGSGGAKGAHTAQNIRLDKIRGSLIGGAAGDALGYAVEFMDEDQIFSVYGRGGIRYYDLGKTGRAQISDDTQMTLFTANGLLLADTDIALNGSAAKPTMSVFHAYQDWLQTQYVPFSQHLKRRAAGEKCVSWLCDVPELFSPRAPGNTCISALQQQKNADTRADVEHPINSSKGCGGVMRLAPMGLKAFPKADIRAVDYEGANLAAVTHGHSLGYMPAAMLTHIIHRIVYPAAELTLKQIVLEARDTVASLFSRDPHIQALTALTDLAVQLSENNAGDLDNIHRLGEGWVGDEAFAIAVYCALKYQNDFSAGIIASVNHKGDSDSTGAVTGNILGAWLGLSRIADEWKQNLELYDVILEMADDLYRGCPPVENGAFTDPDWQRKYVRARWKPEDGSGVGEGKL